MSIRKFTKNINHIQALNDRPNTADGLTAAKLKERFDQSGNDIKEYINETLIPDIEGTFESEAVPEDDPRLTNSRKCNNEFDNYITARENLHIKAVTSLPSEVVEDEILLLY